MAQLSYSADKQLYKDSKMIKSVLLPEGMVVSDEAQTFLEALTTVEDYQKELEQSPEWQVDNLEYDLRSTEWMLEKVRESVIYAQHLYAALCNNSFQRNEVWPILTDKEWSCSWRYAGGILADMQGTGDYMDFYCSGIRGGKLDDDQFQQMSRNEQEAYLESQAHVPEGFVTDEVAADLFKLGWIVLGE